MSPHRYAQVISSAEQWEKERVDRNWYWWGDSSSIQFLAFGACSRVQSKRYVECYYTKYSCRTYLGCVHSNICLLINMPQLFHRLKNERKRELTGKKIREKKGKWTTNSNIYSIMTPRTTSTTRQNTSTAIITMTILIPSLVPSNKVSGNWWRGDQHVPPFAPPVLGPVLVGWCWFIVFPQWSLRLIFIRFYNGLRVPIFCNRVCGQ